MGKFLEVGNASAKEGTSLKSLGVGTALEVQCLRLHTLNIGGMRSIPGQGTKTPHGKAKKKKKEAWS